ncbi:aerolysin family beta-barrel pore-forming toxin [Aeromonas veronii]|uniref:aerolysin family beta-barrel pore-forming toxin n=1 Tax=Aeromonas veronii TaxID=654 RepID=UPI002AC84FBE|nr:aerolysin family beta-barrel pore-forming toxin [Aeromonas veronii]
MMNKVISVNIILLSTIFMLMKVQAAEPIYPAQVKWYGLGQGVCANGYRPLTRDEAMSIKNSLVSRMGPWQITGLADGWVIMGPGYNGEIKKSLVSAGESWCYPNSPVSGEIPTLSDWNIPAGDEVDVQWRLVHDNDYFIKPVSYLAYFLGYARVGGNHSPYVGEDMDVTRLSDGWLIKGNNDGGCSGYRCGEKSSIKVSNFSYTLDPDSFSHGQVTESGKQLVKNITANAINNTDQPQQVVVTLKYDKSTKWSKTDTYSLGELVEIKTSFQIPQVSKTEYSVEISSTQSWASQQGEETRETVLVEARPTVPPYSSLPVRIALYKSNISYPYEFKAEVNYDLTMKGFLRRNGNAWYTHPENGPTLEHTFAVGPFRDKASSIRYQWDKRYIPGEMKWWDWNWAISEYGLSTMQSNLGLVLRTVHASVTGDFYAESQFAGDIEIGLPPTTSTKALLRSASVNMVELTDLKLDRKNLASEGFGNVSLTLAPAH